MDTVERSAIRNAEVREGSRAEDLEKGDEEAKCANNSCGSMSDGDVLCHMDTDTRIQATVIQMTQTSLHLSEAYRS
jgi:hypothetical protein